MSRGMRAAAVLGAVAAALTAGDAAAQGVRGHATTGARYIELRPITRDSVDRALVTEQSGRFFFDGREVACPVGPAAECVFFRPADVEHAAVLTQDVSLTAWGLGVQGLSATTLLRGRADLGGEITWPRADDEFDAILAYLQLDRGDFRFRLGRQQTLSGLGFSGFDGATAGWRPLRRLGFEVYGGRSLARGLNEPRNEALRGIESFLPDDDAVLIGALVQGEPWAGASASLRYQREIWADRSGLVSERASLDARSALPGPLSLNAGLDYDFAFGRIGKSHLTLQLPVEAAGVLLEATARRYVPYFELWTIWGYFNPVAYHEGELRATWLPDPALSLWARGALRAYEDADVQVVLRPLEDQAVRFGVGGRWAPAERWSLDGGYTLERGFGAFLSSGDVTVRWQPLEAVGLAAYGTAFQQIEEFRVGDGTVWGGGLSADVALPRGIVLDAGATVYRQSFENRGPGADWNQLRAWSSLRVPIGSDPGLQRRDGRGGEQ